MRRLLLPALLGLAHGAADASSGLLLGSLARQMSVEEFGLQVMLYNLLGFGCQPLAGMVADRFKRPRAVMIAGMMLLASALLCAGQQAGLGVMLAGIGSAAFHSGGGALALAATRDRAAGPGLFAAPGAVGLASGFALALTGHVILWPFVAALLLLACAALSFRQPEVYPDVRAEAAEVSSHDAILVLLLAAIALRSSVWTAFQSLMEGDTYVLVAMAAAATAGKAVGGVVADFVGGRRFCIAALGLAAVILTVGKGHLALLLTGVALLQSATPVCLVMMAGLRPERPATAAGFALGLGIFFGGVPAIGGMADLVSHPFIVAAMLIASAASLWLVASRPAGAVSLHTFTR